MSNPELRPYEPVVDFSVDSEYHTQLNNKVVPLEACLPTSFCNALETIDAMFPHPDFMDPADYLTIVVNSAYGRDIFNEWFNEEPRHPLHQYHQVINTMVNKLAGTSVPVTKFVEGMDLEMVVKQLEQRRPVVFEGRFTKKGHVVTAVGYVRPNPESLPTHLIIDDPFGDWNENYKAPRGNSVRYRVDALQDIWTGHCHIFSRGVA